MNIPFESKERYNQLNQQLYQWKEVRQNDISNVFVVVIHNEHQTSGVRYMVLQTTAAIVHYLPEDIHYEIISPLEPVWGIAAYVPEQTLTFTKSEKYVLLQGTKHFNSGQKLYPFPKSTLPFDHNETILVVGKRKNTGEFITIMQSMRRMSNWQLEFITNPIIIFLMRYQNGWRSREELGKTSAQAFVNKIHVLNQSKGLPWPAGFPKNV